MKHNFCMVILAARIKKVLTVGLLFVFIPFNISKAQLPWPSETWNAAVNLTSTMDINGLTDLSGLHWNPTLNRLFLVQGSGVLRVLELNTVNNTFSQIGNLPIIGDPEDITQVNYSLNEFYTIDESNYKIIKYNYTTNLSALWEVKSWNLLNPPSPMTNTGKTGPEGIAFVPDGFLSAAGFISQSTGKLYTSTKGMGGLLFIAHQDLGYIWVFDVNPNVNDDFAYVGKYKTNRDESCDLEFDRSTGLLYILHNIGVNYLEVNDLKSSTIGLDRKLNIINEYTIANPVGNTNIEGFAIKPKCTNTGNISVWLCRDVESIESIDYQTDCIREYNPFTADGDCVFNSVSPIFMNSNQQINLYPNPSNQQITISLAEKELKNATIKIIDAKGQMQIEKKNITGENYILDVSNLRNGFYLIEISQEYSTSTTKWLKN